MLSGLSQAMGSSRAETMSPTVSDLMGYVEKSCYQVVTALVPGKKIVLIPLILSSPLSGTYEGLQTRLTSLRSQVAMCPSPMHLPRLGACTLEQSMVFVLQVVAVSCPVLTKGKDNLFGSHQ